MLRYGFCRLYLGLCFLLVFRVGVPLVLDVFLLRGGSGLPVLVEEIVCLVGLGGSLGLGLFSCDARLLFCLLSNSLGVLPSTFCGFGEEFLFIDLFLYHGQSCARKKTAAFAGAYLFDLPRSRLLLVHLLLLLAFGALLKSANLDASSNHLLELALIADLLLLLRLCHELALLLELFDLLLVLLLLARPLLLLPLSLLLGLPLLLFDLGLGQKPLPFLLLLPAPHLLLLLLDRQQVGGQLLLLAARIGRGGCYGGLGLLLLGGGLA